MIKEGPWAGFDAMRIVRQEAGLLADESCFIEVSASGQIFRSPRFQWDMREKQDVQDSIILWRDNVLKQVKVISDGRKPLLTLPKPVTLTLLGRPSDNDLRDAQRAAMAALKKPMVDPGPFEKSMRDITGSLKSKEWGPKPPSKPPKSKPPEPPDQIVEVPPRKFSL